MKHHYEWLVMVWLLLPTPPLPHSSSEDGVLLVVGVVVSMMIRSAASRHSVVLVSLVGLSHNCTTRTSKFRVAMTPSLRSWYGAEPQQPEWSPQGSPAGVLAKLDTRGALFGGDKENENQPKCESGPPVYSQQTFKKCTGYYSANK